MSKALCRKKVGKGGRLVKPGRKRRRRDLGVCGLLDSMSVSVLGFTVGGGEGGEFGGGTDGWGGVLVGGMLR